MDGENKYGGYVPFVMNETTLDQLTNVCAAAYKYRKSIRRSMDNNHLRAFLGLRVDRGSGKLGQYVWPPEIPKWITEIMDVELLDILKFIYMMIDQNVPWVIKVSISYFFFISLLFLSGDHHRK